MNSETIVYCVVALILGMLLANMLKSVCGCKTVEGQLAVSCCKNITDEAECHAAKPHCDWVGESGGTGPCQRPSVIGDIITEMIYNHKIDPSYHERMLYYLEGAIDALVGC